MQCPPLLEAKAGQVQVEVKPDGVSWTVTLYGSASVPRTCPRADGLLDDDVVDRVPANVVVTAKVRSRAEEAAEGAVVEGG